MSEKLPNAGKTPWRFVEEDWEIRDANNYVIARPNSNLEGTDYVRICKLIVEAVNTYDAIRRENAMLNEVAVNLHISRDKAIADAEKLRELVRRLIVIRQYIHFKEDPKTGLNNMEVAPDAEEVAQLLREAKEAIGKEEEP